MKKIISVRVEEEMLEKVKVVAEEGGRSVNRYIHWLICRDLRERENKK